jgi:hypothetical protein
MYIIVYLRDDNLDTLEEKVNNFLLDLQKKRGTIYIERSELIWTGTVFVHHLTIRTS